MIAPTLPEGFVYDGSVPGTTRNGALRVKTPLLYPDGSNIDVYLEDGDDGRTVVTDFGNTDSYLFNACVQTRGRREAAQSCDVDMEDGEIFRRSDDDESFAVAIILVAYACHAVSRNV